jgi:ankyrin repeat protein/uncharacterized protein DUF1566
MNWKVVIKGVFVAAILGIIGTFFLKSLGFNIGRKINPLESNDRKPVIQRTNDGTKEEKHFSNGGKLTMQDKHEAKETRRDGNFVAYDNEVVYDTRTGLEWFVGPDKNTKWKKAKSWVENLDAAGGGWRMPTCDELRTLFRKGAGTRNMSPLFKGRGRFIWSGESGKIKGSLWYRWEAAYFNFNFDGFNDSDFRWFSSDFRSFAVRIRQAQNLLTAAYQRNITLVKDFLDAGADVNAKDEDGYTALIMAAKNGEQERDKLINQYKIVQLLVDNGADVNAKQKDGHTALKYARRNDLAQVIKILKQHGAEE